MKKYVFPLRECPARCVKVMLTTQSGGPRPSKAQSQTGTKTKPLSLRNTLTQRKSFRKYKSLDMMPASFLYSLMKKCLSLRHGKEEKSSIAGISNTTRRQKYFCRRAPLLKLRGRLCLDHKNAGISISAFPGAKGLFL